MKAAASECICICDAGRGAWVSKWASFSATPRLQCLLVWKLTQPWQPELQAQVHGHPDWEVHAGLPACQRCKVEAQSIQQEDCGGSHERPPAYAVQWHFSVIDAGSGRHCSLLGSSKRMSAQDLYKATVLRLLSKRSCWIGSRVCCIMGWQLQGHCTKKFRTQVAPQQSWSSKLQRCTNRSRLPAQSAFGASVLSYTVRG